MRKDARIEKGSMIGYGRKEETKGERIKGGRK